jgi:homogentisate 1,2-dioxygenase
MTYYQRVGEVPKTRHTIFRQSSGELYHEEMMGTEGFEGHSSLLYHIAAPTRVQAIKAQPPVELREYAGDVLRHHRFMFGDLSVSGDFYSARVPAFFNDDVTISISTPDRPSEAFHRNGDSDEMIYVHEGAGEMLTQFGAVPYRQYDWVYIPRNTIVDWRPTGPERLVVIESLTNIRPPSHYLSPNGQFLEAAPYCERDLRGPELRPAIDESGNYEIRIKTRRLVTSYWVERHPFDVVGWDGCFYPYAINAFDFLPITHAIHTMPNIHQIFATGGAAICNIVPRPADYHPLGIPAAPNHSSVDCDEVLYLVGGAPVGRIGDGPGTTTFHPRGIPHGPKPGTYERSIGIKEHSAIALMVDTFRPLKVAETAMECDDSTYPNAWVAH